MPSRHRPAVAATGVVSLVMLLVACTTSPVDTTTPTTVVTTTAPAPTTTLPPGTDTGLTPRELPAFADFSEIKLLGDSPLYAGPATPSSLDGVLWEDEVPPEARDLLVSNGFAVVESGNGQFHEVYSHVAMSGRQPLFVTTDAAYHAWHLVFSKALRDTEQQVLLPILEGFVTELLTAAQEQATELAGTSLEADSGRVVLYGRLLAALLDLEDGSLPAEVQAELDLIEAHAGFGVSPTTGVSVDYSLFNPRGHYARTPELTRYFLAMSSLGLTAFGVDPQTLLLARTLTSSDTLIRAWTQIYEPTAFLVGLADDYTLIELAAVADEISPEWRERPDQLATESALAELEAKLLSMRAVKIDAEQASVRVMGARFVLDSFIIDQLIYPNVGTAENPRLKASPLDVAAAFGSEWAHRHQIEAGEESFANYPAQLEAMTALVEVRESWAGTVYDAWLHALQPLWITHGAAYPDFMQTDAWTAKSHSTGFGSYAELKHDTILYAKQAFAEGETPLVPAEPRHWVEPEPVVYARLAATARLLQAGLETRQLLDPRVDDLLERLVTVFDRFERLARDELAARPISPEDNLWLESIGAEFELLWLLSSDADPSPGGFAQSPDSWAAIIADIMSNPGEALEIGTGFIDTIYVIAPNDQGSFQVARGGVYSYYEFWVPRGERLTDEEWRQQLADDTQPDRPEWTELFLTPQP
jgi:Protein of unknown function (DUF3160)